MPVEQNNSSYFIVMPWPLMAQAICRIVLFSQRISFVISSISCTTDDLRTYIAEAATYTPYLMDVYEAYDHEGSNEVPALLMSLSREYLIKRRELARESSDAIEVFYELEDRLLKRIANDPAVIDIDSEVRQLCVDIVLVDAFMRCRIFEGPNVMDAGEARLNDPNEGCEPGGDALLHRGAHHQGDAVPGE